MMDRRSSRLPIRGYHGTTEAAAKSIVETQSFHPSTWMGDWLGRGIYFFQDAPVRAWEWAQKKADEKGERPAVVAAVLELGICLDLLDIEFWPLLRSSYQVVRNHFGIANVIWEDQHGVQFTSADGHAIASPHGLEQAWGRNWVDCTVIDLATASMGDVLKKPDFAFQSVRCAFTEGTELYRGSHFIDRNHVQVCIRDTSLIGELALADSDQLRRMYGVGSDL